jgi:DNA mismatch endonuclease (patch repair protein)
MQANRSRDTQPELRLRRILHGRGLRYFVNRRALASARWKADLVFPTQRIAVFVDGCYWHGCPEHYSLPRVNTAYWAPKIEGNRTRDRRFDELLRAAGWTVIRAWEHEDPVDVADRVEAAFRTAQPGSTD